MLFLKLVVFSGDDAAEEVVDQASQQAEPIDTIAAFNPALAQRVQADQVRAKFHSLKTMLYQYAVEGDDPPTNEQGLQALVSSGYLNKSDITDEWGSKFVYRLEWGKETPWGKEYKIFVHS